MSCSKYTATAANEQISEFTAQDKKNLHSALYVLPFNLISALFSARKKAALVLRCFCS